MADEKSRSWVYDDQSPIDPPISNGKKRGKRSGTDDINSNRAGNRVEMDVWKDDEAQTKIENNESLEMGQKDWTEAKKVRLL